MGVRAVRADRPPERDRGRLPAHLVETHAQDPLRRVIGIHELPPAIQDDEATGHVRVERMHALRFVCPGVVARRLCAAARRVWSHIRGCLESGHDPIIGHARDSGLDSVALLVRRRVMRRHAGIYARAAPTGPVPRFAAAIEQGRQGGRDWVEGRAVGAPAPRVNSAPVYDGRQPGAHYTPAVVAGAVIHIHCSTILSRNRLLRRLGVRAAMSRRP